MTESPVRPAARFAVEPASQRMIVLVSVVHPCAAGKLRPSVEKQGPFTCPVGHGVLCGEYVDNEFNEAVQNMNEGVLYP